MRRVIRRKRRVGHGLKPRVSSVAEQRDPIIAALDFLISGV